MFKINKHQKVTGFPDFKKHMDYLSRTFERTRVALAEASPEIVDQTKKLLELKKNFDKLQKEYESKGMEGDAYLKKQQELHREIVELEAIVAHFNSSFQLLSTAIDPQGLHEIYMQMYVSIISCIAVASSKTAEICSVGFSIGHVISDRALILLNSQKTRVNEILVNQEKKLEESDPTHSDLSKQAQVELLKLCEERDWAGPTARFIGNCVGVAIAYMLEKASLTFSACTLGSEMVVEALENICDPLLAKMDLPTLQSNPGVVTVLQTSLVAIGFSRLFTNGHPSTFTKILLFPLFSFETFVEGVFLSSLRKK